MFFNKPKVCCVCARQLTLRCMFRSDDADVPQEAAALTRQGYFCREHFLEKAEGLIKDAPHPFVYFRYPLDGLKEAQLTFYSLSHMRDFDFDDKDCQDLRTLLSQARPAENRPVVLVPYEAVGDATQLPLFKDPDPDVELISKEDVFRDLTAYLERMESKVPNAEFCLYPPATDCGGLYCWHNFT